jgi:hypothetical protein
MDSRFTPPDGVWIRRVTNGWHVVSRDADDFLREVVYADAEIAMGDCSEGRDSGAARALLDALWDHFEVYTRSKHRAGLVLSVGPSIAALDAQTEHERLHDMRDKSDPA